MNLRYLRTFGNDDYHLPTRIDLAVFYGAIIIGAASVIAVAAILVGEIL